MKACLICDDHAMVREALAGAVRMAWPHARIATASNFGAAWSLASNDFDLCLLDLVMPGANPLEGVKTLLAAAPNLPVLVVTGTEDDALLMALLGLGIRGFVPKTANAEIIDAAIRLVLAGGRYLPERLLSIAASPAEPANSPQTSVPGAIRPTLSDRQIAVLALVAQGRTNKEIGRELAIAPSTVKTHLDAVLRVLGAANRAEAVRSGLAAGLLGK